MEISPILTMGTRPLPNRNVSSDPDAVMARFPSRSRFSSGHCCSPLFILRACTHLDSQRNLLTQSLLGPAPTGQPFQQGQAGFAAPTMGQPYHQMPGSAGGYGRGNQGQGQWAQPAPNPGAFPGNGFGGYQG